MFRLSCCFRDILRRIRPAELEEANDLVFFRSLRRRGQCGASPNQPASTQGVTQATGNINQGNQALTTNYAAALSPFTTNLGASQQGVGALGNALGLNGPAGTQSALTALQMTPGYQASLGAGNAGVMRRRRRAGR